MSDDCGECGFVFNLAESPLSGEAVTAGIRQVAELLTNGADVRSRRAATTWSPLEYACHLRDVMLVQRERVLLARRVDGAQALNMGRDERAEFDGYAEQDPADVARQLIDATSMYVRVIGRLSPADWDRTLVHGPSARPLRWTVAQAHHEVQHHLLDIRRQLAA